MLNKFANVLHVVLDIYNPNTIKLENGIVDIVNRLPFKKFDEYNASHIEWTEDTLKEDFKKNILESSFKAELEIYLECQKYNHDHGIVKYFKGSLDFVINKKTKNLKLVKTFIWSQIDSYNRKIKALQNDLLASEDREIVKKLNHYSKKRKRYIAYHQELGKTFKE